MADSAIAVLSQTGQANSSWVDTRTMPGGDHRQVFVLGDPALDNVVTLDPSTVAVPVREATGTGATTTAVALSASTSAQLLASAVGRLHGAVYNPLSVPLYVRLGAAATTALYTVQVPAGGYYEVPQSFTGAVHGIATAAGSVMATSVP